MPRKWRYWVMGAVLVLLAIFGTDWMLATQRLDDVLIEVSLDPPAVVADGKNSVSLVIHVTEEGRPRANDLLQSWIDTGSGLLIPQWVYTDENGTAGITYTPNPRTRYDVQDKAIIGLKDLSIGRLIEVAKEIEVEVPLTTTEEQEQEKLFGW